MIARLSAIALAGAALVGCCGVALAQESAWDQPDQQGMRATHALNMLEAQGDGHFRNFHRAGDDFSALVTKNGATMRVLINPDTNQIEPAARSPGSA